MKASSEHPHSTNLMEWNVYEQGKVTLDENWLFVKNRLLSYEDAKDKSQTLHSPSTMQYWSKHGGMGGKGAATYYKEIILQEDVQGKTLGLYVPDILTAYRLWINGDLVHEQGQVSLKAEQSEPMVAPAAIQIVPEEPVVEVMMHIANHHQAEGGPMDYLQIGLYEDITYEMQARSAIEIILFGAFMLSAGHHFVLYLLRRKERENLYFSLYCVILSVRVLLTGEMMAYQLFPDFDWIVGMNLEYLTFYAGAGVLLLYLNELFKHQANPLITYVLTGITGLFSLFVIVTPVQVFTESLLYFQLFTSILFIYAFSMIVKAIRNGVEGAVLTVILFAIFSLTVINDMLYHQHVFDTVPLAPFGMLFMIFGQTTILTMRTIKTYQQVEQLSEKQKEWQRHLEQEVENRTTELEQTMKHLKHLSEMDGLTGIPNRRLFDEHLEEELRKANRQEQSIALLMIDIDNYKAYNDYYGHLQGDDCLKDVAITLQDVVSRTSAGRIYRYGGEEFAVLLCGADLKEAATLAERLRKAVENEAIPHEGSDVGDRISVSIGCTAVKPEQTCTPSELISRGDAALYQAKRTGKNKVVMAS